MEDHLHLRITCVNKDFLIHCFISGNGASIPELVDFIFAAQIAKKMKKEIDDSDDITCYDGGNEVLIFDPINMIFHEIITLPLQVKIFKLTLNFITH